MVRDPNKDRNSCALLGVHDNIGHLAPNLPCKKKAVPSTSNTVGLGWSWTLGRQQLDTQISEKSGFERLQLIINTLVLQAIFPIFSTHLHLGSCGVLIFGAASPASPSPPPSPPSVVQSSAHHIAIKFAIMQLTFAQTSRHLPCQASSHQHCHRDIITP